MAEIIKTTFQLRRGTAANWNKNNPILADGEPGYVLDENILKIGDGITPWKDLKVIGGSDGKGGIFNAKSHYEFPTIGSSNTIYKAEDEKKIYQWNSTSLKYEVLSEVEITIQDLEIIHGGNANGTT